MVPITPSSALTSSWWRQSRVQDRLRGFRAARRHPTPPFQSLQHLRSCQRSETATCSGSSSAAACESSVCGLSPAPPTPDTPPVILISACLLHCPVTLRGTAVQRPPTLRASPLLFLTQVLAAELGLVRCVPVCPEMDWLRMPAPRPPIRLVEAPTAVAPRAGDGETKGGVGGAAGVVGSVERHVVYTAHQHKALLSYNSATDTLPPSQARSWLPALHEIDAVVLKSKSPSCGVEDARVYASTPRSGRSKAASYTLTDGFFTQLLRNSLAKTADGETLPRQQQQPPLTVITSDRLLRYFEVAELSSSELQCEPEMASLEAFMEAAVRHRDWRLTQETAAR